MRKIITGKVSYSYKIDEDRLLFIISDRISAFDIVLPKLIPDKGKISSQLSTFWFNYTKDIIQNHVIPFNIKDCPSEIQNLDFKGRSMLVKRLDMLPIECIVRGYLNNSEYENYINTGKVDSIKANQTLLEFKKLPEPIFTPSLKTREGHNELMSFDDVAKKVGRDLANTIKNASIEIYKRASEYALEKGIIIADTKLEFGLDEKRNIVLADEILTPDSSKFWISDTYEFGKRPDSLDKHFLINWLIDNNWSPDNELEIPDSVIEATRNKYIQIFEILTGKKFKA